MSDVEGFESRTVKSEFRDELQNEEKGLLVS